VTGLQSPQLRVDALADALVAARRSGRALPMAPWFDCLADAEAAYGVQDRVAQALGWFPSGVAGYWKSGGPSRGAALTHAGLPPQGVHSAADGAVVDLRTDRLHQPGIELEVALRTARAVSPADVAGWIASGTMPAAMALVDAMTVAIEVVDLRWQQPLPEAAPEQVALLKLADQQAHGALVLGPWQPFVPRDWAHQRCELRIGAGATERFEGTHPLRDPAWLLPQWLAHVTRHGRTVPAGTVVTTGTWNGVHAVQAGDRADAEMAGMGRISLRF